MSEDNYLHRAGDTCTAVAKLEERMRTAEARLTAVDKLLVYSWVQMGILIGLALLQVGPATIPWLARLLPGG